MTAALAPVDEMVSNDSPTKFLCFLNMDLGE